MKIHSFRNLIFITFISIFSVTASPENSPLILFVGDSLTAGFGIPKEKAFPELIKNKLALNHGKNVEILNGGVSGSTSASALSRLKWFLKKKPTIVVLALGANDGLRGVKPKTTYENLKKALLYVKEQKIKVLFCGVRVPPNYGPDYAKRFEQTFSNLATELDVPFYPQILKNVAGEKSLNLEDGIHPNEKGHEVMANNLTIKILELL
tara:strand:- start:244 stop:867 length:624 start_codon:yes stop_codon:yes gene_type:complete